MVMGLGQSLFSLYRTSHVASEVLLHYILNYWNYYVFLINRGVLYFLSTRGVSMFELGKILNVGFYFFGG